MRKMSALPSSAHGLQREVARILALRLKARPLEQRKRVLSLSLGPENAPQLYARGVEEAEIAWRGIESLEREGLVRIEFDKRSRLQDEPWHRSPRLVVQQNALEGLARLGEVVLRSPFYRELASRLASEGLLARGGIEGFAARCPEALEEFGLEECVKHLRQLRKLAEVSPYLFLREASARIFHGRSKFLDGRRDWVALALGCPCPWADMPISLQVAAPCSTPVELVFVENLTTFERLRREAGHFPGTVFLYSAGFKGSAARVSEEGAHELYFDADVPEDQRVWVKGVLIRDVAAPVHWFGDLDYSGMAILKALRTRYNSAGAWPPGYGCLLKQLSGGNAHLPDEAEKAEQRDPGFTGCPYADLALLPALRETGRFVDQEVFHVGAQLVR